MPLNWFSKREQVVQALADKDRALAEWLSSARRFLNTTVDLYDLHRAVTYRPSSDEGPLVMSEQLVTQVPIYLVGTRFLSECYKALFLGKGDEDDDTAEVMFPITGIRFGPVMVWDAFIETPMVQRSMVTAVIDSHELSLMLRELDRYAHALYGFVHSHRHTGAPKPSSVDMTLQRTLEGANYPAVQAVFSESGHIRFFSDQKHFEVMTYGAGLERLDYRLFRLAELPKTK